MEPLDFGGAKQCQTIALLMGVAHPHVVFCFPNLRNLAIMTVTKDMCLLPERSERG